MCAPPPTPIQVLKWIYYRLVTPKQNTVTPHPPCNKSLYAHCVHEMCVYFFFGGGGIYWSAEQLVSLPRSWFKDHLITLPVFVLKILIFVKKNKEYDLSPVVITLSDRITGFIQSPVQLFFPHGKVQAFSALTSFFCSHLVATVTGLGISDSLTFFSSFTKWLPKSFRIVSFNSVASVRPVLHWHVCCLRCESSGVSCLEW